MKKYPVELVGINGEIPFRLRKAAKWQIGQMTPENSLPITIDRCAYGKYVIKSIAAKARYNEKTLFLEEADFKFASGTGRGAFVINLPDALTPRFALMGSVEGFDMSEFYAMTGFVGIILGKADAKVELITDEGWDLALSKLEADMTIRDGALGEALSRAFLLFPAKEATTVQAQFANELLTNVGSDTWEFETAEIALKLNPHYYDQATAIDKFERIVKAEVLGNYSITGYVYPFARFEVPLGNVRPLKSFFAVKETFKVENMQMRLALDRASRRDLSLPTSDSVPAAAPTGSRAPSKTSY